VAIEDRNMSTPAAWVHGLATDLRIAIAFSTRLPVARSVPIGGDDVARASWALPIAGLLVGGLGALAYWIAFRIGLPASLAVALALVTTMLATGCLHEDGLADTADGFGGGKTREHKLEIMRDSRVGTFGVCALAMSLLLRWSALTTIGDLPSVAMALLAAHASARATLPALMRFVPPARTDGLSAQAGRPAPQSIVVAGALGAIALALGLGPLAAIISIVLLVAAYAFMAWLSMRQIGGQTGDVLGALEQINEVLVLLTAVVLLKAGR
jgi:adenosylcobinamide-GDP ribazoletransferase